jgi:hypothetical protein
MTLRYAHLSPDHTRVAVGRLDAYMDTGALGASSLSV